MAKEKKDNKEEERIKYEYAHNPVFKRFMDDKALDRINDLASAAHLLIQVAMTFEAETENILQKYGLFVHDIKNRAGFLEKAYDQYQNAMRQYYTDKMEKNFVADFDKILDDMFVYLGMRKDWKPGRKSTLDTYGFQNAIDKSLSRRGGRSYRYIERNQQGKLLMSMYAHGTAIHLPSHWFKSIKRGETAKVVIYMLKKY